MKHLFIFILLSACFFLVGCKSNNTVVISGTILDKKGAEVLITLPVDGYTAPYFHEKIKPDEEKKIYIDVWATWCGPCKEEFKYNEA